MIEEQQVVAHAFNLTEKVSPLMVDGNVRLVKELNKKRSTHSFLFEYRNIPIIKYLL